MANFAKIISLFALLFCFALAQDPCPAGSDLLDANPIGSCIYCEGQLWVAPSCAEGYWCRDTTGEGCHIVCETGFFLITDFTHNYWECVEDGVGPTQEILAAHPHLDRVSGDNRAVTHCPVNEGYHVCTADYEATTPYPADQVTANPLGTCRCDGEIWVAAGCTYGFICNSTEPTRGGEYVTCPAGEYISVDFDAHTPSCSDAPGNCPGGPINGIGCAVTECVQSVNPFGTCECDDQVYINEDCTEAFYCQSNIPDPFLFDGCIKRCLNGQILVPNLADNTWECTDTDGTDLVCPGKFHIFCPEDDIGRDFNGEMCDCEGQIFVSSDCQESFYCMDRGNNNGGFGKVCDPGQTVDVNFNDYSMTCSDDGQCPGMGGFQFGCEGGSPPLPPLQCNYTDSLGTCGCDGQLIVNEDCTESILCSHNFPDEAAGMDSCIMNCEANERVHLDLITKNWECITREDDFVCPGELQLDCEPELTVECGCPRELWMGPNCKSAFLCYDVMSVVDGNNGKLVNCPNDLVVQIDFSYPPTYACVEDVGQCPGSFHFGCTGDWSELTTEEIITTVDPDTTTEDPNTTVDPNATTEEIITTTEEIITTTEETITTTEIVIPIENCAEMAENPIGDCDDCEQYFSNGDCSESFLCTARTSDSAAFAGCSLLCDDPEERVDLETWTCVAREENYLCPGVYTTDCEEQTVECECRNQVWVMGGCQQSFVCESERDGTDVGVFNNCGDGEVVEVNLEGGIAVSCVADEGQCLGAYHYGCVEGDFGTIVDPTTEESGTEPTPTLAPGGGSAAVTMSFVTVLAAFVATRL